jgi:hypothetical protein
MGRLVVALVDIGYLSSRLTVGQCGRRLRLSDESVRIDQLVVRDRSRPPYDE